MTTPYDLIRYGWSLAYWAVVESIPTAWAEVDLAGFSLPTGISDYAVDLVIDGSAEVGSSVEPGAALGAGLPLGIQLRDGVGFKIRDYLAAPTRTTTLTSDLAAGATTALVEDTSSFPAGPSSFNVGNELIAYGAKTPTSFTGLTRSSKPYLHYKDSTASLVSNVPRSDWKGREIRLYAAAVDPSGHLPGTDLEAISTEVWRGTCSAGPTRTGQGTWQVDALSLDRLLSQSLPASFSGKVDATNLFHTVQAGDKVTAIFEYGTTTETLSFTPYTVADTGISGVTYLSGATIRKKIEDDWATAMTSQLPSGAKLGSLKWWANPDGSWQGLIQMGTLASTLNAVLTLTVGSQTFVSNTTFHDNYASPIVWIYWDNPLNPWASTQHAANAGAKPKALAGSVTVVLEDEDPADVPDSAAVKIDGKVYTYQHKNVLGGAVRLCEVNRKCQMPPPMKFSGPGETKASHVPGGAPCQTMPPSSPAPCASTNRRQLPQATHHGCARKWAVTSASGARQERGSRS